MKRVRYYVTCRETDLYYYEECETQNMSLEASIKGVHDSQERSTEVSHTQCTKQHNTGLLCKHTLQLRGLGSPARLQTETINWQPIMC